MSRLLDDEQLRLAVVGNPRKLITALVDDREARIASHEKVVARMEVLLQKARQETVNAQQEAVNAMKVFESIKSFDGDNIYYGFIYQNGEMDLVLDRRGREMPRLYREYEDALSYAKRAFSKDSPVRVPIAFRIVAVSEKEKQGGVE